MALRWYHWLIVLLLAGHAVGGVLSTVTSILGLMGAIVGSFVVAYALVRFGLWIYGSGGNEADAAETPV